MGINVYLSLLWEDGILFFSLVLEIIARIGNQRSPDFFTGMKLTPQDWKFPVYGLFNQDGVFPALTWKGIGGRAHQNSSLSKDISLSGEFQVCFS